MLTPEMICLALAGLFFAAAIVTISLTVWLRSEEGIAAFLGIVSLLLLAAVCISGAVAVSYADKHTNPQMQTTGRK